MFSSIESHKMFEDRRNKLRTEAKKRELAGVIVCSRGGGTWDRYSGGDYFTNHYQQRCYLPDNLPRWSGRSHSLLLVPTSSEEDVLLVTTLEYRADLVAIKDVRYRDNFFELIGDTLREKKMDSGKVGIIYEDVITGKILRKMYEECPEIELIPCDDIYTEMRTIKNAKELEIIEKACEIGSKAVTIMMENVKEGLTEAQVLAPGIAHVISEGGVMYFIVANSGPRSEKNTAVHSIDMPGYDHIRKLEKGDLFKLDFIMIYEGYICDFGRTTTVGKPNEEQKELIELIGNACEHVIKHVKPGIKINELTKIGDDFLVEHGVSLDSVQTDPNQVYASFPPHWGHGIGMTWEQPWLVDECDMVVKEGMFLAVEKGLYKPGFGTVTYEQNGIVTKDGYKCLTTTKKNWV